MGQASKVRYLTKLLKSHDSYLFAKVVKEGRIDIFRKSNFGEAPPHLLFSLTDTWNLHGTPVNWGFEPVLNRIKEIDGWNRNVLGEIEKEQAQRESIKSKDFRNKTEDFLREYRRPFAKATDDINTSLLAKRDRRRNHKEL